MQTTVNTLTPEQKMELAIARAKENRKRVRDEAKAELNNFLKAWAEKHLNVSFWEIDHDEEIAVTQEMIDAFHANQPIPLPKFKFGGSHDN